MLMPMLSCEKIQPLNQVPNFAHDAQILGKKLKEKSMFSCKKNQFPNISLDTQILQKTLKEKSSMFSCKSNQHLNQIPNIALDIDEKTLKEKVLIILGATGTGKTKLSLGLAEKFSGEIVNSDKMQIHEGLDIVTNKATKEEMRGIPHHLLSVIEPNANFTSTDFCSLALASLQCITGNGRLPIIVGGSNSFIEALVDYEENMFKTRYEFCCLWVDVSIPVLESVLSKRVDMMLARGMVDEVRQMIYQNVDYSNGVYRSIGLPELDHYFRVEKLLDKETRARLFEKAINEIKLNTHKLAFRQKEKIKNFQNVKKWKIHKLDATESYKVKGKEAIDAWNNLVMNPSIEIVEEFMNNGGA